MLTLDEKSKAVSSTGDERRREEMKQKNEELKTYQEHEEERLEAQEPIVWDISSFAARKAVVELCGWRNKHGNATPMGLRIARSETAQLTPAAKNVLIQRGIQFRDISI